MTHRLGGGFDHGNITRPVWEVPPLCETPSSSDIQQPWLWADSCFFGGRRVFRYPPPLSGFDGFGFGFELLVLVAEWQTSARLTTN